jgi:23S rRNA (adenine2503-C2)-methyltransferase
MEGSKAEVTQSQEEQGERLAAPSSEMLMEHRKLHLQAVTPQTLCDSVEGLTLGEARRIVSAVHRCEELPEVVRNVRREAIEKVRAAGVIPVLAVAGREQSRVDPFTKYSLVTPDGWSIETVCIPLERSGRFSVCVSSQAGCALGCLFCATGRLGLKRNLDTWEMVEQVRVVRRGLDLESGQRVHGCVFQGMGEPLANVDRVIETIRILSEPSGLAIDARAMTVCTAGIPAGIRRLALEVPKVRLGLSITSTHTGTRRALMPIDRAHPLSEALEAAADHAQITGLAPMWAYTLLAGVNDSEAEASEFARLAGDFERRSGLRPRLSIVAYNPIDHTEQEGFRRSGPEREAAFRMVLAKAGLPSHRRYSGGSDVSAACGQLAGRR